MKLTISIPRESCTNAKAKYSSSVVPPDPSVHFYHCRTSDLSVTLLAFAAECPSLSTDISPPAGPTAANLPRDAPQDETDRRMGHRYRYIDPPMYYASSVNRQLEQYRQIT